MRRARYLALSLAPALLALAGCGSDRGDSIAGVALAGLQGLVTPAAPAPDIRAGLTREALDQLGQPLLYAELPARKARAGLLLAARNGPHATWVTADGISLSFRHGVLNASRGLGGDLMAADLDEPLAMIRGGGSGRGVRIHAYLDGENQTYTRAFTCDYRQAGRQTIELVGARHATRLVRETCRATDLEFANLYWVGDDGTVWKSRQWIGPEAGYVLTERLVR